MDPFELMGLPRRPLLSEDEIGSAYRRLAASLHPDHAEGDASRFKELGEASAILRDPARRLRALVGSLPASSIPPEAEQLFSGVASLLRESDELLARHAAATNPLTKAVLAGPLKNLGQKLDSKMAELEGWRSRLEDRLSALDAAWPSADPLEIASLADSLAYAPRWKDQLRERKLTLECL